MEKELNYLATWEEFCEENGMNYEENKYLEEHFNTTQDKLFGFIVKLLI